LVNTSNTFNTFWKGVERDRSHKDALKSIETVKDTYRLEIDEEDAECPTASTSINLNGTLTSKEDDAEHPTETNKTSVL